MKTRHISKLAVVAMITAFLLLPATFIFWLWRKGAGIDEPSLDGLSSPPIALYSLIAGALLFLYLLLRWRR